MRTHKIGFVEVHGAFARLQRENIPSSDPTNINEIEKYSTHFYNAAWELCRLGILPLGVKKYNDNAVGVSDGYCITPYGKEWLSQNHTRATIMVLLKIILKNY